MTGLPLPIFLYGVAFFGLMLIVGVVQVHRKKEKAYYFSALVSCVMLFAFIFAFLNQPLFALATIVAAGILGLMFTPKVMKVFEREQSKRLQETDFSKPLKKRYIFTDLWWFKLASKWGLKKTMCLAYLWCLCLVGGILLVFSVFFSFISIAFVAGFSISTPFLFTFILYKQLKKVLKRNTDAKLDSKEMPISNQV
jgi:hypothetical protein